MSNSKTQVKTIALKLDPANTGKLEFLSKTRDQVEAVARDFLKFKKQQLVDDKEHHYGEEFNDKYKYYREQYPELHSAILQDTMRWIKERFRAYVQQCKHRHKLVKYPNINQFPIELRNQLYSIHNDNRHFDSWLRFCRTNFPLKLSEFHEQVLDNAEKLGTAQIIFHGGSWFVHITCHVPCNEELDSDKAFGVDLGIVNPIVCSDGKRIGNGSRITHKQKEFQKKRSKQQSNSKDITKKQRRWMKDTNHKLSRRLVDYVVTSGAGVLVLEDLKGQYLSNKRWRQYKWSFAELRTFVHYKAKLAGIKVIDVDPAYTSQTCSVCGQKSKDNRKTRSLFECESCGARFDADVNAAKNILGLSAQDGPPVNQAKSKGLNSKPTCFSRG